MAYQLGLHRHELAISVVAEADSRTLVVLDRSSYMNDPEQPVLDLIMPGLVKAIPLRIEPGGLTTLTGWELGYRGRIELPDGVYQLRYSIAPHDRVSVCLNYLKTSQLNARIDDWLLHLGCDPGRSVLDQAGSNLKDMETLLRAAGINAERGNIELASAQYARADRILSHLHPV